VQDVLHQLDIQVSHKTLREGRINLGPLFTKDLHHRRTLSEFPLAYRYHLSIEAWFETINRDLSPSQTGDTTRVSAEAIEVRLVDFKALDAPTHESMGARFKKGPQVLGKSWSAMKTPTQCK